MTNLDFFCLSDGSNPSPARPNFTVTSKGVVLNQWGLNPSSNPDKSNTGSSLFKIRRVTKRLEYEMSVAQR